MTRAKKDIGRKGETSDPVSTSKKKSNTGQTISGHPASDGGSRQGNAGHEHASEAGRGERQS
jgi:hypothetical protein